MPFTAPQPPLLMSTLILSHYVPKDAFCSGHLTETLHEIVFNPIHATRPANLTAAGSDHRNNYW
jgi:hypothetical protein